LGVAIGNDYNGIGETDNETRASHLIVFGKGGALRVYDLTGCPNQ